MKKKLLRFLVMKKLKGGKIKKLGQSLKYSKDSAMKEAKELWGSSAYVKRVKS